MKYTQFNNRPYEAHMLALEWIEPKSLVLDLGCATGYLGRELIKKGCQVIGVESDKSAATVARKFYQRVIIADLEESNNIKIDGNEFDYVLLLDILEHLKNREQLLATIRKWLKPQGILIISTPNIAHISVRLKLLFGDFSYSDWGILDKTHLHFFTQKTLEKELIGCGWLPEEKTVSADFGQLPVLGRFLRHIPKIWQYILTKMFPTLLGVQFVWKCRAIKAYERI